MKGSFSKKATAALLAATLLATASSLPAQATESYARNITIQVDGRTIPQTDQKAFIKNSRTMVPLRTVMEGLNMAVEWNNEKRSITVKNPAKDETYTFYADKPYFLRYKKTGTDFIKLDVAPYITSSNRTVMPLRAIGETYGKVDWDNANSIVKITAGVVQPNTPVRPNTPPVAPNNPSQPSAPVTPQQPSNEVTTPNNPYTPSVKDGALNEAELAQLRSLAQIGPRTEADLATVEGYKQRGHLSSEEVDLINAFMRKAREYKKDVEQKAHVEVMENSEYQSYVTPYAIRVLEEINKYRVANGVAPLKLSPLLCKAADIRARECLVYPDVKTMAEFDAWEARGNNPHHRPDGSRSNTVMNDLGHPWKGTGENLLSLYNLPVLSEKSAAFEDTKDLYESPGHRSNMLNPNHKYMGAARMSGNQWQKAIQFFSS